jgi:RNA:NAD 2'-phosphotransferase (TPT1/KptA family)
MNLGDINDTIAKASQVPVSMPRPNDSPDVAASKTLAYILRHGAEKESLHIRSDGYILLDDVVRLRNSHMHRCKQAMADCLSLHDQR